MVGAVIVKDGQIVGQGFHPKAGEPHAEIFAFRASGDRAKGADMYVTLEPCCHHGRTPPCVDAIIEYGVARVFAAMEDPNPVVAGQGFEALRAAGVEVLVGMMESKARKLNEAYIKRVTTGLPLVMWKAAMTLDGKIASRNGDSRWVTGEQARLHVHKLRNEYDAVVVGIGTVLKDDPELTVRDIPGGQSPIRVIVDAEAATPTDARVLDSEARTVIAVGRSADETQVKKLRNKGAEIIVLDDTDGRVDARSLMIALADMGINSVLLESGGEFAASMIEARLVDRGLVFVAPKILGGRDAKTPVEGEGFLLMSQAIPTSKLQVRRFGDDIAIEFTLVGS
jgi:diaminohydroxyphosphoribosylaminopyrimidine deaminase/5-amino-6-(5-phosphoribosylamino)uracil reductase